MLFSKKSPPSVGSLVGTRQPAGLGPAAKTNNTSMSKIKRNHQANRQVTASDPREVEFLLEATAARSVHLAGDFNDWRINELPLHEESPGRWRTRVVLPPGTYQYRFIVDGQWVDDPRACRMAPNPFGSSNCEIEVP